MGARDVFQGLLVFMVGVLFTYFTFPFFTSLINAITDTTGIFEGWTTIRYIMWAGYIAVIIMFVLVYPATRIMSRSQN